MSNPTMDPGAGRQTSYEHTADTSATAAQVWARYVDVATWAQWNAGVAAVSLDGPFAAGTTGTLTPPGGEPLPFRIVAAEPGRSYTSETHIAETVTLRSRSVLTPLPTGGTRISQHSELVGPAAEYFAASFGPALAEGVPRTVTALARLGTTTSEPA
ncbi:MAG: SRPBCC family protein [Pseudonocardiaceae bacterium]